VDIDSIRTLDRARAGGHSVWHRNGHDLLHRHRLCESFAPFCLRNQILSASRESSISPHHHHYDSLIKPPPTDGTHLPAGRLRLFSRRRWPPPLPDERLRTTPGVAHVPEARRDLGRQRVCLYQPGSLALALGVLEVGQAVEGTESLRDESGVRAKNQR
jgi:hypothetical protein